MDRRGAAAAVPMEAGQDVWDWEVLPVPDSKILDVDQETEERILPPAEAADEPADECKDIGVVPATETRSSVPSAAAGLMLADGEEEDDVGEEEDDDDEEEEEEKPFQSPDSKEAADDGKLAEEQAEEEDDIKTGKDGGETTRPECVVFSVGKLKVNGIGALCSFGVAAATVCVFLVGGRLQHHHRQQQQQKIQLQFLGDDKRIQQVVQQTSRLNQAMSSVMGAGGSTRANISFGGFYDGF
ncbi:hypothetical protein ACP4OV_024498 [Aristida adscensionis]